MPEGNNLPIYFECLGIETIPLTQYERTQSWVADAITSRNKQPGEITFIFTSDEELLKINQQFLSHNDYTDVITFDYSANEIISGDIYISVERVNENASKFGVKEAEELARVMIHGVLHLLGLKDKEAYQIKEMRKEEEKELTLCPFLSCST
jgi:rRNA maturation RNase YbeY